MPIITASINDGGPREKKERNYCLIWRCRETGILLVYIVSSIFKDGNLAIHIYVLKMHILSDPATPPG